MENCRASTKINVEEINEYPRIHRDLEVEMVETTEEEIIEEVVNDLDEVKLDAFKVQAPILLVGDIKPKFIDFVGVERFDSIINSYLMIFVNCMKTVEKEFQFSQ